MSNGKEFIYDIVRKDSQNASHLGKALGWDWLEEEGKRNTKDPSAALRKAAISAATWYAGGALGGAGAGAGTAAGEAAAQTALTAGSQMTAEQLSQIAMQEMASEGLSQAAQQGITEAGSGLLSNAPQGFANTMEAGLTDSGYTPSSLLNAFKNANATNNTSLTQNLQNYGGQKVMEAQNGSLLNRMGSNLGNKKNMAAINAGRNLLTPQPQQQPMPGRPAPQGQQEPLGTPYGQQQLSQAARLTEEQKRMLRMKGYRV